MKIKHILFICIIATTLSSCNNEESDDNLGEIVPGQVSLTMEDDVAIDLAFDLINDANLEIESMRGFNYASTIHPDSLNYVIAAISEKAYYNDDWPIEGIVKLTDKILINTVFTEMNIDSQRDWLSETDRLKLTDLENDFKFLQIKVEAGTEQEWVDKFNSNSLVKEAQLAYFF